MQGMLPQILGIMLGSHATEPWLFSSLKRVVRSIVQILQITLIWGLIFNLSKNVMYFEKLFWNIPQRISCTLWENISSILKTGFKDCR